MKTFVAVLTVDMDPALELGPLTLTWHGLGIASGLLLGMLIARRYAVSRGLDLEALTSAMFVLALSGIVGAKILYLAEADPGALLRPGEWLAGRGFAFYGGILFGVPAAALYLRRRRMGLSYLDAMAFGFPLGMAVGRIGDLINGEHYGPPSDLPWAVRNAHPEADVPSTAVAYHSGGLYEIVLALAMAVVIWLVHRRLRRPGMLLWTVIGLYGAGRFLMFFYRSDSDDLALGLNGTQWVSAGLILAAVLGAWWTASRPGVGGLRKHRVGGFSAILLVLGAAALAAAGCGGGEPRAGEAGAPADVPVVEDAGPIHVHGLGINSADRALFIATHTGLFRAGEGESRARRVGDRSQDTMGFTIIGPDRFLGSGHPDGRDGLPPFLGLIRSEDAARTWKPVSLLGKRDFHALEAVGRRVYGFGSDFRTREEGFLVSDDGGRSWRERRAPGSLLTLAAARSDPDDLIVGGARGVHRSQDAGRSWRRVVAGPALAARLGGRRLVAIGGDGVVRAGLEDRGTLNRVGSIEGRPAALESAGDELYVALRDGTIKRSEDGGRSWRVRSRP